MEIASDSKQRPEGIICQNCGQALSLSDRSNLFTALNALDRLQKESSDDLGYIYEDKGFHIDIIGTIEAEND